MVCAPESKKEQAFLIPEPSATGPPSNAVVPSLPRPKAAVVAGVNFAKETSEITGKKALVFLAVVILAAFVGVSLSPNPEVTEHLIGALLFASAAAWGVSKVLPNGWLDFGRTVALASVLSMGILVYVFGPLLMEEHTLTLKSLLPYLFSWVIQAFLVLILVGSARARRNHCAWTRDLAKRRLSWGIVTVLVIQSLQFYREASTGHGVGPLYHIQWIGVFWIARSLFRLQDLKKDILHAEKDAF